MDYQTPPKPSTNYDSNVDTSRPFRSVKEAVAVFGEKILAGEMYSSKPSPSSSYASTASSSTSSKQEEIVTSWKLSSPSPKNTTRPNNNIFEEEEEDKNVILDALKKIETELEETKVELKLLKEKEKETEETLATMNVKLHKNMSRLSEAEDVTEAEAKVVSVAIGEETKKGYNEESGVKEGERRRQLMRRMGENTTLAQILSLGENGHHFGNKREKKMLKKKPIVPLVGDFIFRKKGSSTNFHNSFYSLPQFYN